MNERHTKHIARNMFGDDPFQERARRALPLLVRQAEQGNTIYYQQLADELGMSNPRNLNYVLGSIGTTLFELGQKWEEEIPEIQSLAINQGSGEPGPGYFGGIEAYQEMSHAQRNQFLKKAYDDIYLYPKWRKVLQGLGLRPADASFRDLIDQAKSFRGGGESEEHRILKQAVAENPTLVGLPARSECLGLEYGLPSGDKLDVFFQYRDTRYAVEVKPASAPLSDILRGIFQCVKYQAVIEAEMSWKREHEKLYVLLALAGEFPTELAPLRNALQIWVVDGVNHRKESR